MPLLVTVALRYVNDVFCVHKGGRDKKGQQIAVILKDINYTQLKQNAFVLASEVGSLCHTPIHPPFFKFIP